MNDDLIKIQLLKLGCGGVESRILFYGLIWMVGWDDLVIPWQGEQILERLKMVEKIGLQMKVKNLLIGPWWKGMEVVWANNFCGC